MISKHLKKVAADSNVLLSAVIGKAALRILIHPEIEVITTHFNLIEVSEYLPRLALKYNLDLTALTLQLKMLPVTSFDPEDVFLLALALKEEVPIWSNDKDFEGLPVPVYNTAVLLKLLESE